MNPARYRFHDEKPSCIWYREIGMLNFELTLCEHSYALYTSEDCHVLYTKSAQNSAFSICFISWDWHAELRGDFVCNTWRSVDVYKTHTYDVWMCTRRTHMLWRSVDVYTYDVMCYTVHVYKMLQDICRCVQDVHIWIVTQLHRWTHMHSLCRCAHDVHICTSICKCVHDVHRSVHVYKM